MREYIMNKSWQKDIDVYIVELSLVIFLFFFVSIIFGSSFTNSIFGILTIILLGVVYGIVVIGILDSALNMKRRRVNDWRKI